MTRAVAIPFFLHIELPAHDHVSGIKMDWLPFALCPQAFRLTDSAARRYLPKYHCTHHGF